MAEWMAEEANVEEAETQPFLAREIMSRGGIKPPRQPTALEPRKRQVEEYTAIPIFLRSKRGLPLDEMAAEMGYEYEDDLRQDIMKAYPAKGKGGKKKKRRQTWEDFQDAAYEMIEEQIAEGQPA